MLTLKEQILQARSSGIAIGHFNVSTIDGIWAVADAAKELDVPVIVGVSEGERDYIGVGQIASIVRSIRDSRKQAIYLNADHTYSFERVKEAIDNGFDSVIFDGAGLAFEENIAETRKCVDYAREVSKSAGREVLLEGELGFIGKSSKILQSLPEGAQVTDDKMTKPEEALRFVEQTGVDLLAPAVGNVHGVILGGDPALNIDRVAEIAGAVKVPLVLHGASGNTADDISRAIKSGVAMVHVNTELRIAYRAALVKSLSEDPDEVAPYKYLKPAKQAMEKVIIDKIRIFTGR